jgi:hypothetical protein
MGWIKVIIFSTITAFTVSGFEFYTDWNLWESSGNWLKEKLQNAADSIFN